MNDLIGLFRAKRTKDKKWFEGNLIKHQSGGYAIYSESEYEENEILKIEKINPETICEYINAKDRDKTPVFTNDIVEFFHYDEFWQSEKHTGFIYKGEGCYKISAKSLVFYIDESIDIDKVIGNKFDDIELLKEKHDIKTGRLLKS